MIFFLNKGLILEQNVVKALQDYFNTLGLADFYKNVEVNVTNKHPFARLFSSADGDARQTSLFPAVVVATMEDEKPMELAGLIETGGVVFSPEDVNPCEPEGKSPLEKSGYMMMTPEKYHAIRGVVNERGSVYGISCKIRRHERLSIEIWAENIQLKNELYEAVRLFVGGFMREYFEKLYEENDFSLFDNTVRGQRSNNFNGEFGIDLWGSCITFEADYTVRQIVIDTEIVDENIDFMEVINHVKGQEGTGRSVIIGRGYNEAAGSGAESGG